MPEDIDPIKAQKLTEPRQPVPRFPLVFSWHEHYWPCIFDKQIDLIRQDIRRARADGKLIVYLSCPISARGGGDQSTNIDIARAVERRLLSQWGERFWVLNPAQYQLESKEGTGMMDEHAKSCNLDLTKLRAASQPSGGDYMRMWTKVLVEDQDLYNFDDSRSAQPALKNTGQHFDGFYFIGPHDVYDFFLQESSFNLTTAIEGHFASKFATNPDFRDNYSLAGLVWRNGWQNDTALTAAEKESQATLRVQWKEMRRQYLRFYALRASVNFSLGSHDEWEIFRQINAIRREKQVAPNGDNVGIAEQLAGFFDQKQIDPGAAEAEISRGYSSAIPTSPEMETPTA
jgi:hypothetical protein